MVAIDIVSVNFHRIRPCNDVFNNSEIVKRL